jgi:hypothetical protein
MVASWHLRGLLWVVVVIGMGLFSGCGDGDDNDIPDACVSACETGCGRAQACQFFPANELDDCVEACVDTIEMEAQATVQSCQNAEATFAGASCDELADLLGLRGVNGAQRAEGRGGEEPWSLTAIVQGLVKAMTQGN